MQHYYVVVNIVRIGNMTTNWFATGDNSIGSNMEMATKFRTRTDAEAFVKQHYSNRNYGIVEINNSYEEA